MKLFSFANQYLIFPQHFVAASGQHGHSANWLQALQLLERMQRKGPRPNVISYNAAWHMGRMGRKLWENHGKPKKRATKFMGLWWFMMVYVFFWIESL